MLQLSARTRFSISECQSEGSLEYTFSLVRYYRVPSAALVTDFSPQLLG